MDKDAAPSLQRHFGLLQATALNVTMIVGAGVFITIPFMLQKLPGPYALLGWIVAGALMLIDGMIWSELGAAMPGSGGSYLYLLECFGKERWGKLMAFLFIWQFLISGPLEVGSGLISIAQFSNGLSPQFKKFNEEYTYRQVLLEKRETVLPIGSYSINLTLDSDLAVAVSPSRLLAFGLGVGLLFLLYRRISILGALTVTFWGGVLAAIAWISIEGFLHFDPKVAFDFSGRAASWPEDFSSGLGSAMILAMYSYLGYYNVCYIGDEVRDPGKTIPRAILLSSLLVIVLFLGLHLAMLGTVPWGPIAALSEQELGNYTLPAEFMRRIHGEWAAVAVTLCLIWSCLGSAFAALLGYSRIPYGAARYGHFFSVLAKVHPTHEIPHVSLLFVGALTLAWSFFDLQSVISALITTRILEQFIGQIIGVMILRRTQPNRPRPYRLWFYPVPCGLALVGWLYMYLTSGWLFILLGIGTLLIGTVVYAVWARLKRAEANGAGPASTGPGPGPGG